MNALQIDPVTGFLESPGIRNIGFTAQKKVEFLEQAKRYQQARTFPDVSAICESIGVDAWTFDRHLGLDQNFANAWKEISTHIEYQCISDMSDLRRKNPMYMFGLLRYLNPKRWNPNERPEPTLNINVFSEALREVQTVKDAEIVDKSPVNALESGLAQTIERVPSQDMPGGRAAGPGQNKPHPPHDDHDQAPAQFSKNKKPKKFKKALNEIAREGEQLMLGDP